MNWVCTSNGGEFVVEKNFRLSGGSDVFSQCLHERVLWMGCRNGSIWSADLRAPIPTRPIFQSSSISSLIYLPITNQLLTSNMNSTITTWDTRYPSYPFLTIPNTGITHTRRELRVDKSEMFGFVGGDDGIVRGWDLKNGKVVWEKAGNGVAVDGTRIFSAKETGLVEVWGKGFQTRGLMGEGS